MARLARERSALGERPRSRGAGLGGAGAEGRDGAAAGSARRRVLLRLWRDVPFPHWLRALYLRLTNPSFGVGVMAAIQDEQGRILILEHTYRRAYVWGLPGGWLKRRESPEQGLAREVLEETGLRVSVGPLLGATTWGYTQIDLLYRCAILGGSYGTTDETSGFRWCPPAELPPLMPHQRYLLEKAGVVQSA